MQKIKIPNFLFEKCSQPSDNESVVNLSNEEKRIRENKQRYEQTIVVDMTA
jgi:hypothetical protein